MKGFDLSCYLDNKDKKAEDQPRTKTPIRIMQGLRRAIVEGYFEPIENDKKNEQTQ